MRNLKKINIEVILVIISGAVTGLYFPPAESSFIIFPLVFILVTLMDKEPEKASLYSLLYGLSMSAFSVYWIYFNSGADLWIRIISVPGLMLINSLFYALMGAAYSRVRVLLKEKAVWTLPLLWGGMEHLMLFEELAFPWTYLAHTLTGKLTFIQIADIAGVISVSMLVVMISVLLYKATLSLIQKRTLRLIFYLQAALFCFFAVMVYGYIRINNINVQMNGMEQIKVSLIHPGLDVEYKWQKKNFPEIISRQFKLSDRALRSDADLIIWGESNFPRYLENNPGYIRQFMHYASENEADMCLGALGFDINENDEIKKYNSVFFFDQHNEIERYDKRKLVPFGERFPFSQYLPFMKEISLGQANFDKGISNFPFIMSNGRKFHTNICYEGLFPYYNSSLVNKGSELIVNVSNDAWYEGSSQVYQHSRFNIFRAVENRRTVVRLANLAENSVILPTGEQKILFFGGEDIERTVTVPLNSKRSFYTLYGRYFAYLVIGLNILLISASIIYNFRKREK